ncbi:Crp/Fnr family transcriptional regulator [Leptothrix discophora]|uniref:Crp/Fnr family transcriptional regulator n=1 Tax=Leptothrix discophora TaxID=89 RepID=A0ABT9G3S9_LEPDI|nr:Crp/Fnr family transcriptional regulator [Leptothrix discophora]MDP4301149.1 Crp/Fnr family transcriptional regulator [Leptothrix discophora]
MNPADDPLDQLAARYPEFIAAVPPGWRDDLPPGLVPVEAPAGALLFDEGSPCRGFPLVLDGAVRVARGAPQGRAIELYRVLPGEICIVSSACLFGEAPLTAHGITLAPTRLLLLPPSLFMAWSAHEPFRRHIFGQFAGRMSDLILLAEAVAFQRLDQRLAGALLGRGTMLHVTHQQLADELGTVREMVTRLLKRFEQSGWVRLGRERVEIVDAAALRQMSKG